MSGSFETKNMTPLIATLLSSVGAPLGWLMTRSHARQLTLKKRRAGGFTMVVVAGLLWGVLIVGWLEIQRDMTAALDSARASGLGERDALGFFLLAPVFNFLAAMAAGAAFAHFWRVAQGDNA
ncbi:MAG: hypothetical protein ABL904_03240 [Hyphomicrobiaceae bacterium]